MRFDELNHKEKVVVEAIENIYINNKYVDKTTWLKSILFLINKYKTKK